MQLAVLTSDHSGYPLTVIAALRQRRIELDIRQYELARQIVNRRGRETHQSTLAGWESGAVTPTPDMLAAWAAALGVRVVVGLQEIAEDER